MILPPRERKKVLQVIESELEEIDPKGGSAAMPSKGLEPKLNHQEELRQPSLHMARFA